jgi:hypothetical protein
LIGDSVLIFASFLNNCVVNLATNGDAEVPATSDARCAVKAALERNGCLLVLGKDARAKENGNSESNLSSHFYRILLRRYLLS